MGFLFHHRFISKFCWIDIFSPETEMINLSLVDFFGSSRLASY